MKQFKSSRKQKNSGKNKKQSVKQPQSRKRQEKAGMPAKPNTFIPPSGQVPPGGGENNIDYDNTGLDLNLSPLGTPQAGFGEFFDDEWDADEDMTNDIIRARDNASEGEHPTKKKNFLEDGDR